MTDTNQRLQQLIIQSKHIHEVDKSFLISKMAEMSPMERLRLEQTLASNMIPESLQEIAKIRQEFLNKENKPSADILSKLIEKVVPPSPRTLVSESILLKPHLSGSAAPHPATDGRDVSLKALKEFRSLEQLIALNPAHITFRTDEPEEQTIQNFIQKLDDLFQKIHKIEDRRTHLMSYMQSLLFNVYINTGVTALRHPELQPRAIALNQIHQIDNRKYLSKKQFEHATEITNHLRMLCAL